MRLSASTPLFAAFALAACGGGEPEEAGPEGNAMSAEQVASAMDETVQPRPGQYETRVELLDLSMPGMPQAQTDQMREIMAGQFATGNSFCLTPEEAAQGPERMVQELAASDCVFNSFEMDDGSLSADMQCTSEDGMQGNYVLDGEMSAESSTMTMQIDQSLPGVPGDGRMQLEMRVNSQRTGACA